MRKLLLSYIKVEKVDTFFSFFFKKIPLLQMSIFKLKLLKSLYRGALEKKICKPNK